MDEKLEKVKVILKNNNQEQLLNSYNKLDIEKKEELLNNILNIDFGQISKLYEEAKKEMKVKDSKIEPISYIDKETLEISDKNKFESLGRKIIQNGQYAVVTMAGGQRNKTWAFWT